ncbi:interferon-induced protein 44-like isoform X3 [Silurus meridionalis]|uniref:interferon-induced protein 44-like isoform X3 n=1 Tax=Silurus meridionalis TaxID=175797 RepID=UPI001EEAE3AB|nr:interferon-induced protein 44-like isoform X3 [Silurus meridionalis]XP_046696334.1 interferon-induced protein 44-like isoform X3 [Silurus meridionalis]
MCVEGEHRVRKEGTKCILEIFKAKETDEGKYTLNLSKSSSSVSCSTLVKIVIPQWREVKWERQDEMLNNLKTFKVCNPVEQLNFLLYGLVGAGKSSTINTIRSIFEGRLYVNCLAAAGSTTSQTLSFGSYNFKNDEGSFPFAFYDVMGAEAKAGVNTQDIISALKGHMKEGYKFISNAPVSESDLYYNRNPSLSDQMHCLVNIIAADRISIMDNESRNKWKTIKETASSMGIPQVLFITHVDRGCPLIKDNLQNIYKSRKIKEKMIQCSNLTGIPMNLIFPVVNYHEQTNMNTDINCLMLDALKNIAHWVNDYVKKRSNNQNSH